VVKSTKQFRFSFRIRGEGATRKCAYQSVYEKNALPEEREGGDNDEGRSKWKPYIGLGRGGSDFRPIHSGWVIRGELKFGVA